MNTSGANSVYCCSNKHFSKQQQSASFTSRPNFLIDPNSESHEFFKNVTKKLSFDWEGGKPAGFFAYLFCKF